MFSKIRLGLNQLAFYEPVHSGIDYLSVSGGNRVTGLYYYVMLKEPITKENLIFEVLTQAGWTTNSQGTVWYYYQ